MAKYLGMPMYAKQWVIIKPNLCKTFLSLKQIVCLSEIGKFKEMLEKEGDKETNVLIKEMKFI